MIKNIVYWPAKILQASSESIEEITEETRALSVDLIDTMLAYGGIGMAAPQIGIAKQMFVVSAEIDEEVKGRARVFINPQLLKVGEEMDTMEEGCLSFPDIILRIKRPKKVLLRATDELGINFTLGAEGLLARAIQHELDHLSGKLFTDFFSHMRREMIKKKMLRWKKVHLK